MPVIYAIDAFAALAISLSKSETILCGVKTDLVAIIAHRRF
jgi:hypothetical protein